MIAQIRVYTTRISSSISPLSSNPFISEIVLTTVTGEIASRFTKEHLQSFLFSFFCQKMVTITKFSCLVGAVRVTSKPPEKIISFSILYLSFNQTRGLTETHTFLHTCMHTLEKVHTKKTHTHTWQQSSFSNFKVHQSACIHPSYWLWKMPVFGSARGIVAATLRY